MGRLPTVANEVPTAERIRGAAVELMFERGFHGTSLRDVSAQVGVQMSSLYHHFPSKQALLMDIMSRTMEELLTVTGEAMRADLDPTQRLTAGIATHVRFHAERRMENFITDSEIRALEPENREVIVAMRDQHTARFRAALEEGKAEGRFAYGDASVVLASMFSMISAVPTWYRPNGRLSLDAIATEITGIFLHGVQRRI